MNNRRQSIRFQDGETGARDQTRDSVGTHAQTTATPTTTEVRAGTNVREAGTRQPARFPPGYSALNMSVYGTWDSSLRSVRSESNLLEIEESVKQHKQNDFDIHAVSLQAVEDLRHFRPPMRPETGARTESVCNEPLRQSPDLMNVPEPRGNRGQQSQVFETNYKNLVREVELPEDPDPPPDRPESEQHELEGLNMCKRNDKRNNVDNAGTTIQLVEPSEPELSVNVGPEGYQGALPSLHSNANHENSLVIVNDTLYITGEGGENRANLSSRALPSLHHRPSPRIVSNDTMHLTGRSGENRENRSNTTDLLGLNLGERTPLMTIPTGGPSRPESVASTTGSCATENLLLRITRKLLQLMDSRDSVTYHSKYFLLPNKLRYFKENLIMDLNHFLSATGDPPVERDDQLSEGIRAVFMSHQPEVMEEPSFRLFLARKWEQVQMVQRVFPGRIETGDPVSNHPRVNQGTSVHLFYAFCQYTKYIMLTQLLITQRHKAVHDLHDQLQDLRRDIPNPTELYRQLIHDEIDPDTARTLSFRIEHVLQMINQTEIRGFRTGTRFLGATDSEIIQNLDKFNIPFLVMGVDLDWGHLDQLTTAPAHHCIIRVARDSDGILEYLRSRHADLILALNQVSDNAGIRVEHIAAWSNKLQFQQ